WGGRYGERSEAGSGGGPPLGLSPTRSFSPLLARTIDRPSEGAVANQVSGVRPSLCPSIRRAGFAAGEGDADAFVAVLLEFVAQGADRDAEDVGGVGAVAEAVIEGLQDQIALDVGDGAAHDLAVDGFGGLGGAGDCGRRGDGDRVGHLRTVGQTDRRLGDL